MVRRSSSSSEPARAVTVPAQNFEQPETEALGIKLDEEASNSSDADSMTAREEIRDQIHPAVALELPQQEPKTRGRNYSKVFPSSWTLPSRAKPPPTNVIDYGNPAQSVNRPTEPGTPRKFQVGLESQSYSPIQTNPVSVPNQSRSEFSAESGEGDTAPRPPERYEEIHPAPWDLRNIIISSESGNARGNGFNPVIAGLSRDRDVSQRFTSYLPYRQSAYSANTTSSGSGDVPARAPHVSSTYSPTIHFN